MRSTQSPNSRATGSFVASPSKNEASRIRATATATGADFHVKPIRTGEVFAATGGSGTCGKCRVIIEEGEVEGGVNDRLKPTDVEKGVRLACQSVVKSDLTVRIPVESAIDASVLNLKRSPRKTAQIQEVDFDALKQEGLFMPPVEKRFLTLPEPNTDDRLPDVARLVSYLNVHHGEHRLVVRLPVIRKIPDLLRESGFEVTATLARPESRDQPANRARLESRAHRAIPVLPVSRVQPSGEKAAA